MNRNEVKKAQPKEFDKYGRRWTPPTPVTRANFPDAGELFDAGLTTRARNCLIREGYKTLGELENASPYDLLDIRGFGVVSLWDVTGVLLDHGRTLHPRLFDWWTEEKARSNG